MRRLWNHLVGRLGHRLWAGRVILGDGRDLTPISPQTLDAVRRHFPRPKFFIFGHARSGTTLLGRLVRLHPHVHCNWQAQLFSRRGPVPYLTAPGLLSWLRTPANHWTEGEDPTTALLRVYCDFVLESEAARVGKPVVGDKSTNGSGAEAVRWLGAVYPDAHLAYLVRDGRDTILSKRIQAFLDQPRVLARPDRKIRADLLRDPGSFRGGRRSLFTPRWLQAAARRWAIDVRESVTAGKDLFGDRFLALRYEDLLQDPVLWMGRLWSWLGVAPEDLAEQVASEMKGNPAAEWHDSMNLEFVRQLPRGSPGGWREVFTAEDRDLFEKMAGGELRAWGYESSPLLAP